jgi:biopolymer transport protein ExbD
MIKREEKRYGWCRNGLRTRYRPKLQICGGLINAAPWLNILLLLVVFVLLMPRVVLSPGRRVELPEGALLDPGVRSVTAVVLSHRQSTGSDSRSEMIFFEDQPFAVDNPAQMQELKRRFFRVAHEYPETILVIEADVHVEYGTIARLCTIAGKTGLKTVNLAGRLPEERPRE